ncbi:MAG TPA: hypothetical protein VMB49_00295 [Acidobacteriaceae bacterium]|nr:hypothetical protein [Acidobacteriaceae bacterium]
MSRHQGNFTVFGKEEVVVDMALTAKPKMFDLHLVPNPMGGTYDPTTTKVVELLAALWIHALRYHVAPLELLR